MTNFCVLKKYSVLSACSLLGMHNINQTYNLLTNNTFFMISYWPIMKLWRYEDIVQHAVAALMTLNCCNLMS